MLHIRLRKGSANTARGAKRFVDELLARVARASASAAAGRATPLEHRSHEQLYELAREHDSARRSKMGA